MDGDTSRRCIMVASFGKQLKAGVADAEVEAEAETAAGSADRTEERIGRTDRYQRRFGQAVITNAGDDERTHFSDIPQSQARIHGHGPEVSAATTRADRVQHSLTDSEIVEHVLDGGGKSGVEVVAAAGGYVPAIAQVVVQVAEQGRESGAGVKGPAMILGGTGHAEGNNEESHPECVLHASTRRIWTRDGARGVPEERKTENSLRGLVVPAGKTEMSSEEVQKLVFTHSTLTNLAVLAYHPRYPRP